MTSASVISGKQEEEEVEGEEEEKEAEGGEGETRRRIGRKLQEFEENEPEENKKRK